jgi:hypothetical protein
MSQSNNLQAFGNMIRVIRNMYNAVFETATAAKRNTPFRMSTTTTSGIVIGQVAAGAFQGILGRIWSPLVNTGATTYVAATGIVDNVNIKLQALDSEPLSHPSQGANWDTGWIMARFTPSWASASQPTNPVYVFNNAGAGVPGIQLYYQSPNWVGVYGTSTVSRGHTWAGGPPKITVFFAWSKSQNYLRAWASNFAMASNTVSSAVVARSAEAINIGFATHDAGKELHAKVHLYAMGTGVLTDEMVTLLKAMPDGANQFQFPVATEAQLSFLWDGGDVLTSDQDNFSLGIVGVSVVAA